MEDSPEVVRALGRLESKVDMLVTNMPAQDTRIRSLEESRAKQSGVAAAIAAGVSLAMGLAGYFVHKP